MMIYLPVYLSRPLVRPGNGYVTGIKQDIAHGTALNKRIPQSNIKVFSSRLKTENSHVTAKGNETVTKLGGRKIFDHFFASITLADTAEIYF